MVAELDTTEHTHISHNFFFFLRKTPGKKKNVEFKDTKKSWLKMKFPPVFMSEPDDALENYKS